MNEGKELVSLSEREKREDILYTNFILYYYIIYRNILLSILSIETIIYNRYNRINHVRSGESFGGIQTKKEKGAS